MTKARVLSFAILFGVLGCNKSPSDRTSDASGGGGLGRFGVAGSYVIFNDELVSGGGAFEYPGSEGQSLSFVDRSNPVSQRSIRYSWTGAAVANPGCAENPSFDFAGFDLMHTPLQSQYATTAGRDLRQAGYTRATFYARGSLATNVVLKVEAASSGNTPCLPPNSAPCITLSANGTDDDANYPCGTTAQLTSSWGSYTITLPNSALANVKDFFKATFVFNEPFPGNQQPGQGGVVYLDRILYQP